MPTHGGPPPFFVPCSAPVWAWIVIFFDITSLSKLKRHHLSEFGVQFSLYIPLASLINMNRFSNRDLREVVYMSEIILQSTDILSSQHVISFFYLP